MKHTRIHRLTRASGLVAILLCGPSLAAGTATPAAAIAPYHATFEASSLGSLDIKGVTERSLSRQPGGQWQFNSRSSVLFASVHEQTDFETPSPHQIQPQEYLYKRKVLGKSRAARLSFDWPNGNVTNTVANQPWQMPIAQGTQDKLSYQLQLRLDLIAGKKELSYQVADGGHMKSYQFEVIGQERISTPAGEFDTVKVQRRYPADSGRTTLIWFAPALNHQMVKLYSQSDEEEAFTLALKSLDTEAVVSGKR